MSSPSLGRLKAFLLLFVAQSTYASPFAVLAWLDGSWLHVIGWVIMGPLWPVASLVDLHVRRPLIVVGVVRRPATKWVRWYRLALAGWWLFGLSVAVLAASKTLPIYMTAMGPWFVLAASGELLISFKFPQTVEARSGKGRGAGKPRFRAQAQAKQVANKRGLSRRGQTASLVTTTGSRSYANTDKLADADALLKASTNRILLLAATVGATLMVGAAATAYWWPPLFGERQQYATQLGPVSTPDPDTEALARGLIERLSKTNAVVRDFETIRPIVVAVIRRGGIHDQNRKVTFMLPEKFNPRYCRLAGLSRGCIDAYPDDAFAFVSDRDIVVREGGFYQALEATLRELAIPLRPYNVKGTSDRAGEIAFGEIGGNLGWVFASAALAERFGYDPSNNLADTPETRKAIDGFTFGDADTEANGAFRNAYTWLRVPWLVAEDLGFLDRGKPEQAMTADEALAAYRFFVSLPDPNKYVEELLAKHDLAKDDEWARQVLRLRLNRNKHPTDMDTTIIAQYTSWLPTVRPQPQ